MKPRDIFNFAEHEAANIKSEYLLSAYWALEEVLATEMGHSFSYIGISIEDRTCCLCGHINGTNEWGKLPDKCQHPRCNVIWEFWNIGPFPDPWAIKNPRRRPYLKLRMKNTFGVDKLAQIPRKILFEFLLNAMIERMGHEKES